MREHVRLLPTLAGLAVAVACGGPSEPGVDAGDQPTGDTETAGPASGDTVPNLSIEAFDGSTVSLADYRGTPMVVNFWASWCPPCIAEMPDLEAVSQTAAGDLAFVGVNTQDAPAAAAEMVEETGVTYDLVRDPDAELFQAFGVFGMPSTFYVDAEGAIVGRHTGLLTRDALVEDLRDHLGVAVEVDT